MITRAQAEALLTLAESLEACEREGVEINVGCMFNLELDFKDTGKTFAQINQLSGMDLRLVVSLLSPKRSGRLADPPNYQELP